MPAPWPGRSALEPVGRGLLGEVLLKAAEGRSAGPQMQQRIEQHRSQLEATRRSVGSSASSRPPSHRRGCCTTPL